MASAQISLRKVGKRFNHEWIFRGVDHTFQKDEHTVILGPNGSGKSTLLQVILGSSIASEGELEYQFGGCAYKADETLGLFSLATPYLELIEEFTLTEMLEFHQKMKAFKEGWTIPSIIEKLYLTEAKNKPIRYFSSGMKQRVKLGIALLSDTPFVMLDEPTSNLDAKAIEWYKQLVEETKNGRIIIVCSNDQKDEFPFCIQRLNIGDYK
ncbi:MAG: ATP-binding cassette domain-containing protein [Flavobacteriales bacterium]|nr:ATP-binding cassette domain-containing protein [Flavobacteriales bacterium]